MTTRSQSQKQRCKERQLDRPVRPAYTTTPHQSLQTIEMALYASDAENKAT